MTFAQIVLAIICVVFTEAISRDEFLDTFVPRMESLIAKDLADLGEITCTLNQGGDLSSISAAFSGPYALLKIRRNGKGMDTVRNPDYYAVVSVTPDESYSVTHFVKSTDDSWSTIFERMKLPLFSMIMTGKSTIPELARSGEYTVSQKDLDGGSEFTLTAIGKGSVYHQIIFEFDSRYDFPVTRTEYFDESKSNGGKYFVRKFEMVNGTHFPTSIEAFRFSGSQKGEMTIDTTFDRTKLLDVDQCNLEAYNIKKPNFELANQRKSYLPKIFIAALVLIVASGGTWYFFRKPSV